MSLRSPWLPRTLLGVGLAALIATLISIAVGEGGPDAPPNEGFNDVQRLFGGIEQEGAALGAADAPVLIEVFNDVNCSACADYQVAEIDPLVEEYVRSGRARLEFSHFSVGPRLTTLGALAATAAGVQGRQWQYLGLLTRNLDAAGPTVDEEFLTRVAEIVPELDLDQWERGRSSERVREIVDADAQAAVELRLPPQPAVIVTGPGGDRVLQGSPKREEIESAVDEVY